MTAELLSPTIDVRTGTKPTENPGSFIPENEAKLLAMVIDGRSNVEVKSALFAGYESPKAISVALSKLTSKANPRIEKYGIRLKSNGSGPAATHYTFVDKDGNPADPNAIKHLKNVVDLTLDLAKDVDLRYVRRIQNGSFYSTFSRIVPKSRTSLFRNVPENETSNSLSQRLAYLRKNLPEASGEALINLGTNSKPYYLLVDAGRENEILNRLAQKREDRRKRLKSRMQIKKAPKREKSTKPKAKEKKDVLLKPKKEKQKTVPKTSQVKHELTIAQNTIIRIPRRKERAATTSITPLSPEDAYWLARSISSLEGQEALSEYGYHLWQDQDLHKTLHFATDGQYIDYDDTLAEKIKDLFNNTTNTNPNHRTFSQNRHIPWLRDAFKALSSNPDIKPGDLAYLLVSQMKPIPFTGK